VRIQIDPKGTKGQRKYKEKEKEKEVSWNKERRGSRVIKTSESNLIKPRSESNRGLSHIVEDYRTLKIATHNINGIKGNMDKLEMLLEWASKESIDLIGINETNTTERQNNFSLNKQEDFLGIWTDAEENKKKGSGVGLIIKKKWEKHLSQVTRNNAYCIEALFVFTKQKILVIVVYIPHNNQKMRKDVQQRVIRRTNECRMKGTKVIVIGDFNDIRDKNLDQSREESRRTQKLPLMTWLGNSNMTDAFRKLHPQEKKFTRVNEVVKSRIDYIWVSREFEQGLLTCEIVEADTITSSDHAIVVAKVITGIMSYTRTLACNKRLKGKQWIFQLDKANEEDWEKYKSSLDKLLKRKLESKEKRKYIQDEVARDKDELWDIIATSIIRCARTALPGKKVAAEDLKVKKKRKSSSVKQDLKRIGSICQECGRKIGQQIESTSKYNINNSIIELNKLHGIKIRKIVEETWTEERHMELKTWWKILYAKLQQERRKEDLSEINVAVNQRCEAIQGELKHMLSSLLERSSKRVILDRIVKKEGADIVLVNKEKEVLEEVRSHFKNQFRKRNTQTGNLSREWEKIYNPIERINDQVYSDISEEVKEEEWLEALHNTKVKSAPGPSGISYPLIKKVGPLALRVFRQLASICIQEGEIPVKWKLSKLYPIPKGENWNYNLANVRPIILLETFRKAVVRIITHRLDKIIVKHNILQGPNFAGLSGDSTAGPIHIMNNIIEDARQKNNELWVLFQDMRKAFDSVSLEMLKKALLRIKLPNTLINFIISLYEKRKIKVITNYGLTDEFEAEDGIDQGEVISPLVWRIFYDPLLYAVQKTKNLGYKMITRWPTDLVCNKVTKEEHRQAVLAYADDTTWIASSKKEMQEIMNIASEFYEINDIEINNKKSELLVINVKKKEKANGDSMAIDIGKKGNKVYAKKETSIIRHLGVWISAKNNKSSSLNIIKQEISEMCRAIRWKKASVSQLVYLNNCVLLPSIEYRLQTVFLSKSVCDKIQRPIWMLIKNKLELASTTANSICSHNGFLGLRSIWQNQLTHHFTELIIRLNRQEDIGKTTRLRLREGQLQSKSLSCPTSKEHKFSKIMPKYNLAYKVLYESARVGLQINKIEESPDNLNITGNEIVGLLEKEEAQSFVKTDQMSLYVLEQLVTSSGCSLLTWQQIKYTRSWRKKGRTPGWFRKLEEKVLKGDGSRELQESFKTTSPNRKAIKIMPKKIATDRRKREWVLFKRWDIMQIGKIERKTKKGVEMEHWKKATCAENSRETFIQCKNCDSGTLNNKKCLISLKFSDWHQVIDISKVGDRIELKVPIDTYTEEQSLVRGVRRYQDVRIEISANNLESAIIQRVIEDKEAKDELIKQNMELKGENIVEFYTDGSLVANEGNRSKMGIGWIAKVRDKIDNNISFRSRLENWPSSTRAELGAIWAAILAAPVETQVHIFTDSKSAIEAVEKAQKVVQIRSWFKLRNRSILRQIIDCSKAKKLELRLHKVKSHSGNKANDIADRLAKEGTNVSSILSIPETAYDGLTYAPKWKSQSIDSSLRTFVNVVTESVYETEWAELSKVREITIRNQEGNPREELIWKNTWLALKKLQGKRCISIKKSKALIFRIKCINNILPTKDICFQRNPKLYKSQKCIACLKDDETLYHLAECEIYQKIWKNLEEETIQLTRLDALSKLSISLNEAELKEAIFGKGTEIRLHNRKSHLRGLISVMQLEEVTKVAKSKRKGNQVLTNFIEHFWEYFFERLWKFRCEIMVEWEKKNNISAREKKKKGKRKKRRRAEIDKENTELENTPEIKKDKEIRIQKEAMSRVDKWIKLGTKEEWSRLKTK
jgi:exonuclease III/ribonuclease HI